jgi:cell division protein FtsW
MGEGTLNSKQTFGKANVQRPLQLRMDVPFVLIIVTLLVFGILMLFSASWDFSVVRDLPTSYFFGRQMLWAGLGLVLAIGVSLVDYHRYRRLLVPMMIGMLGMLAVTLVIGRTSSDPARALVNGSVQPSELAKLATIIYLAFWLFSKKDSINILSLGLFPYIVILGLTSGLIMLQPDFSAAATVIILGGVLFFLSGADWKQVVTATALAILLGFVITKIYPTGSDRIGQYLEGLQDPTKSAYQVLRSFEAIVNGGIVGVGLGQASTKFTGLPLPMNDGIFLVILYVLLIWRGLTIARRAPDQLGAMLAGGLTLWIAFEAALNMTAIVGLSPVAGNALPFVSAGGSNLVCSLIAVGIILNVARCSVEQKTTEGRSFGAVVDLRRWDRRRRVSRPRGSPGTPTGS